MITLAAVCVAVSMGVWALGLSALWLALLLPGLLIGAALIWGQDAAETAPWPSRSQSEPEGPAAIPAGVGRALLQQLPSPLLVVARNGQVSYANPAAHALLPDTQISGHVSNLFRAPPFVQAYKDVRLDGLDRDVSFTVSKVQERYFEARLSLLPAGNDFGAKEQILILIEDRTRDRLSIQTRSDFVANASHELRTPLASIVGFIETLQNHARDDDAAREKFLGIMAQQARRMHGLIDDLMSLSRIEMSAHMRPVEEIDLFALVDESASAMMPMAMQAEFEIDASAFHDASGPMVRGDREQLQQVFSNLISNAMKYGGPDRKVVLRQCPADLRYPGMVGVAVCDKGIGIEKQHIHRLTERFFRVSPAKSRDKGGTGLGLAIVKHILNRHEGGLDIASEPGEGSTFTVWLPRVKSAPEQESP